MPTPELECAAKLAIRDYMNKCLALPGVAISVVMFLLGYSVKDVAYQKALYEAQTEFRKHTDVLVSQLANERIRVSDLSNDAKRLQSTILGNQLRLEALIATQRNCWPP